MLVRRTDLGEASLKAEATWGASGKAALAASPDYFLIWYTIKSIGLGAMVGVASYYIGFKHGAESRR